MGAAKATACSAAVAGVVFVREVILAPATMRLEPLPWATASSLQRVGLAFRSMERVIRYFPYRHRLVTVVLCGMATGATSVVAEYRMMASAGAAAAPAASAEDDAPEEAAPGRRSITRVIRENATRVGGTLVGELRDRWHSWQDQPPAGSVGSSRGAAAGSGSSEEPASSEAGADGPTDVLGSIPSHSRYEAGEAAPAQRWGSAEAVPTALDGLDWVSAGEAEAEAGGADGGAAAAAAAAPAADGDRA